MFLLPFFMLSRIGRCFAWMTGMSLIDYWLWVGFHYRLMERVRIRSIRSKWIIHNMKMIWRDLFDIYVGKLFKWYFAHVLNHWYTRSLQPWKQVFDHSLELWKTLKIQVSTYFSLIAIVLEFWIILEFFVVTCKVIDKTCGNRLNM